MFLCTNLGPYVLIPGCRFIIYYFPIQNCPWLCILTSLFVYKVAEMWGKDQLREELVHEDKTMHPLGWKFIPFWVQVDTANACSKFWNNRIYWSTLGFLNLQVDFPNSVGREHRRKSLEDLMWCGFVCSISLPALLQHKLECVCSSVFLRPLLKINSHVSITKPMQLLRDTWVSRKFTLSKPPGHASPVSPDGSCWTVCSTPLGVCW